MNDRTSAAPPPDFLGESPEDYERHFAMDWKPPDLGNFGRSSAQAVSSNYPGNRTSFRSVNSGFAGYTNRNGAGPKHAGSGFFKQVKQRFGLARSRSTYGVTGEEEGGGSAGDGDSANDFVIPPVFKHKRSESMGVPTLRARDGGNSQQHDFSFLDKDEDNTFARSNTNTDRPAAESGGAPLLPGFDPTKRPTRDEIAANYKSLLASGFFGTHAIQSTRFSPPGKALHGQDSQPSFPSLSERLEDGPEASQGIRTVPPSPERMPPPPPPQREPPQPPTEPIDTEDSSSTPAGVPASDTVVFNPVSPEQKPDSSVMPPPGLTPAKKLRPINPHSHSYSSTPSPPLTSSARTSPQHSLSFSSVPYTLTSPGAAPIASPLPAPPPSQLPYHPPPVSLSRFSVDSGRPRSFEFNLGHGAQRGTKRPFTSTANSSQSSFVSSRTSYDADVYGDGIGVATSTPAEGERHESGARKFVKRLRKSASRVSFSLGNAIARQTSQQFDGDDAMMDEDSHDTGSSLEIQPPPRTSVSSTIKRSFSRKFGGGGGKSGSVSGEASTTNSSADYTRHSSSSTSSSGPKLYSGTDSEGTSVSLNNSADIPDASTPLPAHAALSPALSVITGSPNDSALASISAERNRLKKREIRGRRFRRSQSSKLSPSRPSPLNQPPLTGADAGSGGGMDWLTSPTKLRKSWRNHARPRRSEASMLLHAAQSRDGADDANTALGTGAEAPAEAQGMTDASNGMEGVEFSFHFPGRVRPGVPLAVVPDANRGIPNVPGIPAAFKAGAAGGDKRVENVLRGGSVRVVPRDLI